MAKDTLNTSCLRFEQPRTDFIGILDHICIFKEFISNVPEGGIGLLYSLMEYHLDPELNDNSQYR